MIHPHTYTQKVNPDNRVPLFFSPGSPIPTPKKRYIYIYIYIYNIYTHKSNQTYKTNKEMQWLFPTHTHTHIYIYIYINYIKANYIYIFFFYFFLGKFYPGFQFDAMILISLRAYFNCFALQKRTTMSVTNVHFRIILL